MPERLGVSKLKCEAKRLGETLGVPDSRGERNRLVSQQKRKILSLEADLVRWEANMEADVEKVREKYRIYRRAQW